MKTKKPNKINFNRKIKAESDTTSQTNDGSRKNSSNFENQEAMLIAHILTNAFR